MFFGWNWGRCLRRRWCCSCGHWICSCSRLCPAFHVFTWQARLQYATAWHLEHWRMGGFNALPHSGSEQFKNPPCIVAGRALGRFSRARTAPRSEANLPRLRHAAGPSSCGGHRLLARLQYTGPPLCRGQWLGLLGANFFLGKKSAPGEATENHYLSRSKFCIRRLVSHGCRWAPEFCASCSGGGTSGGRTLPEYSPRPACDGGGRCVTAGTPTQRAACACGV